MFITLNNTHILFSAIESLHYSDGVGLVIKTVSGKEYVKEVGKEEADVLIDKIITAISLCESI